MSWIADEVLELLNRKGCAMSVARIALDLRKPEHQVENCLAALKREDLVRVESPGQWTVARRSPPAVTTEPAAPPSIVDDVTPPAGEVATMRGRRKCTKCQKNIGVRGFEKGSEICRICKAGNGESKAPRAATARRAPKSFADLTVGGKSADDAGARDVAIAWLTRTRDRCDRLIAELREI